MKVIILNNLGQVKALITALEAAYGDKPVVHSLDAIEIHGGINQGQWALPWDDNIESIPINRDGLTLGDLIDRRGRSNYRGIRFNQIVDLPDEDLVDSRPQNVRDLDPDLQARKQARLDARRNQG